MLCRSGECSTLVRPGALMSAASYTLSALVCVSSDGPLHASQGVLSVRVMAPDTGFEPRQSLGPQSMTVARASRSSRTQRLHQ